ncbi:hypothetical protein FOZ63_024580 [Perkinsus olseni]|uniref:Uncharacterized protein n=1 Tax=Perkinsus olseni TaxID=32597 RepID=A0A7J6QTX0_PEROL|nr:hypothetical protein FOZ62_019820 [Perkinsus olseni]KAF4711788.1 hypothetical protein FOZ63_024580 [Perkinsus olseni]
MPSTRPPISPSRIEDDIDVMIDCLNARILCALGDSGRPQDVPPDQMSVKSRSSTGSDGQPEKERPKIAFGRRLPASKERKPSRSMQVQELSDEVRRQRVEISRLIRLLSTKQSEVDRLNRMLASTEQPEEVSTANMTVVKRRRCSRHSPDAPVLALLPTPRPKPGPIDYTLASVCLVLLYDSHPALSIIVVGVVLMYLTTGGPSPATKPRRVDTSQRKQKSRIERDGPVDRHDSPKTAPVQQLGSLDAVAQTGVLWTLFDFLDGHDVITFMQIMGHSHSMYSPAQIDERVFAERIGAPKRHRLPRGWNNQNTWRFMNSIGVEHLCRVRMAAFDLLGPLQCFDPSTDFKSSVLRRLQSCGGQADEVLRWVLESSVYLLMGVLPTDHAIDMVSLVLYLNPAGCPSLLFTRGSRSVAGSKYNCLQVMTCRLPNKPSIDLATPFRDFYAVSQGLLRPEASLICPKLLLRISQGKVVSAHGGSPLPLVEFLSLMGTPEVYHGDGLPMTVDRTLIKMIRHHAECISYG